MLQSCYTRFNTFQNKIIKAKRPPFFRQNHAYWQGGANLNSSHKRDK